MLSAWDTGCDIYQIRYYIVGGSSIALIPLTVQTGGAHYEKNRPAYQLAPDKSKLMFQYLITAVIDFTIFLLIIYNRKTRSTKATAVVALCLGLWSTELFFLTYIKDIDILYPLFYATRCGMFFIPFSFSFLAYSIINRPSKKFLFLLSISFFSTLCLCVTNIFFTKTELIDSPGGYIPEIDGVYYSFIFLLVTNLLCAIFFLVSNYNKVSSRERQRTDWLLFTLTITITLGFYSTISLFQNDFLTKFTAAIVNILFVSSAYYTTLEKPLMDLKPALTVIAVKSLIIGTFIHLFFFIKFAVGDLEYSTGTIMILFIYLLLVLQTYPIVCQKLIPHAQSIMIRGQFSVNEVENDIKMSLQKCATFQDLEAILNKLINIIMQIEAYNLLILDEKLEFVKKTELTAPRNLDDFFSHRYGYSLEDETPEEISSFMREGNFKALFPVHEKGKPLASLAIGYPKGISFFRHQDLTMLNWVANELPPIIVRIIAFNKSQDELSEAKKTLSLIGVMNEYHHDIKTPLSIIDGVISTDIYDRNKQRDVVLEQVERGTKLIATMASILRGQRNRKVAPVILKNIINDSLFVFENRFNNVQSELLEHPPVIGDAVDLKILFINIIKNAAESATGGSMLNVYVKSWKEKNDICVSIEDTGSGMSKSQLENLWHAENSTKEKGSGIGLQAIKRIADEHHTDIFVESDLGKGTKFTLKFPST